MANIFKMDGQQFISWADTGTGFRFIKGAGHFAKLPLSAKDVRDWKIYKGYDLVWGMRLKGPAYDDDEIVAERLLKLDGRKA